MQTILVITEKRWYSAVHSRSMTPITWQAAVDDKEQRPLLQDIFEAAINGNHV